MKPEAERREDRTTRLAGLAILAGGTLVEASAGVATLFGDEAAAKQLAAGGVIPLALGSLVLVVRAASPWFDSFHKPDNPFFTAASKWKATPQQEAQTTPPVLRSVRDDLAS